MKQITKRVNAYREEMRKEEKELFGKVDGIYVNGKKDATLVLKEVGGKYSRKVEIEEHIVMVGQPGEFYLIHTFPDSGTGLSIATSIYYEIKDTYLANKLNVIGSDGTAAMTGAHNGAIRNLEESLHRQHQLYQICCICRNTEPNKNIAHDFELYPIFVSC